MWSAPLARSLVVLLLAASACVMSEGAVSCMGNNANGQLGIGDYGTPPPTAPMPVAAW